MYNIKKNKTHQVPIITNIYFTFIQIPKTGSTTILDNSIFSGLTLLPSNYDYELYNRRMNGHDSLSTISKYIINKDNPIYYIVRNPFTQIYSWFWHCVRYGFYNTIGISNKLSLSKIDIKDFENFIKKKLINDRFMVPFNKYIDNTINKNLKVFRYEDGINKTIDYFNKKYKLHFINININNNPIKSYKKDKKTILYYYQNKEIVDIVREYRKDDFIKYRYSFDIYDI
jgi:hypothetical protein